MKKILQAAIVLSSTAFLTACPDNGGNGNQTPIMGIPNGTVAAYNDPSTYCNFDQNNRTFTCYSRNNYNGQTCSSPTVTYTDLNSMCQQVYTQLQQGMMGGQCNVTSALQRILSEYCQNNNYPQNPQYPINQPGPGQVGSSAIDCQFHARRNSGGYLNRFFDTGDRTQTFQVNSNIRQEIVLHTSLFNVGSFGEAKLIYTPAGLQGGSDQMTLSIKGLNRESDIQQTGFAGQKVMLEAQSDDGSMSLFLSCEGRSSQFRKNVHNRFVKFVCSGSSDLGSRRQKVNFSYNYGSSLVDHSFELARGLKMTVIGDTTANADNARVQFIAEDAYGDQTFRTSAYLKTRSQIKVDTGYGSADITCIPQ